MEKKTINISSQTYRYIDCKNRFNIKSVIWFALSLSILYFLTKKGIAYIGVLLGSADDTIIAEYFGSLYYNHSFLAVIIAIALLIFYAVVICRLVFVFFHYLIGGLMIYGSFKSRPLPRVKYKTIKSLLKSLNNQVYIGEFYDTHTNTENDGTGIAIKDTFVTGSFWCYIVLLSAYYTAHLSYNLECICQSFGLNYFSKLEEKREFNQEVNKNTTKLIEDLLLDVNRLKDTAKEYQAQGIENINNLLDK